MSDSESILSNDSSDEDIFSFIEEEFDLSTDMMGCQMLVSMSGRDAIHKTPRRTSMLSGRMYIYEILNGHPTVCYSNFRIQKHIFQNFCDTLKVRGLLTNGKKVSVEEGVAMFLMIVGHSTRYRIVGDRFQHGNHTIHKWFKRVLRAVCQLGTKLIRPTNQGVVHERILQKYLYFKNCIGAIDGTHVAAWAPASRKTAFRGRKTNVTQNVMLACDFDMKFTFVYAGWEGTANDSRVFIDAVTNASNGFSMPRGDEWYLVDAGYPNIPGFLAPYRERRYHLRDYAGRGRLRGKEELFNYRYSSCRNIIECSIGVLKARFPILKLISNFPLIRQRHIPTACCTIHNFIRQEHALDELFTEYSVENMIFDDVPESSDAREPIQFDASQTAQMGHVREEIANRMWIDYSRRSR